MKQKILGFLTLAATTAYPFIALAADDNLPKDAAGVLKVFRRIGDWLFTFLIISATIMLVIAAYKYLFSGGAEEKTTAARNTIVYAVIALIVAMLAKGIPFAIQSLLSVK